MEHQLNDLALLDTMLDDDRAAASEFSATARWDTYSKSFVSYLKEVGLEDFRRAKHARGEPGHVLASFGAVDINPPTDEPCEEMLNRARSCFRGQKSVAIDDLLPSRIGNPEGFEIEGRFYTLSWLNFYCRYAYVSRFMDLDSQIVVEVGPGSGKQAELLKKAHPNLTILLFDLPTQLYVCNQYLSSVFSKDEVVGYREGRKIEKFTQVQKGKINILPHWKFSIVKGQKFDLFWNAASLQEMGPETAARYLEAIHSAEALYLLHNIKWRGLKAPAPGNRGLISPRYIPHHDEISRDIAQLGVMSPTWKYFDSFWRRTRPEIKGWKIWLNPFSLAVQSRAS